MSEPVKLTLDNGSTVVGRWVTLEEWMLPLAPDHPARKELKTLRMSLANAMAQIDKLERQNATLHQQFIEEQMAREQPKENNGPDTKPEPRVRTQDPGMLRARGPKADDGGDSGPSAGESAEPGQ